MASLQGHTWMSLWDMWTLIFSGHFVCQKHWSLSNLKNFESKSLNLLRFPNIFHAIWRLFMCIPLDQSSNSLLIITSSFIFQTETITSRLFSFIWAVLGGRRGWCTSPSRTRLHKGRLTTIQNKTTAIYILKSLGCLIPNFKICN